MECINISYKEANDAMNQLKKSSLHGIIFTEGRNRKAKASMQF